MNTLHRTLVAAVCAAMSIDANAETPNVPDAADPAPGAAPAVLKAEDTVQTLAGLGKGVHKVKKNADGHIQSCVVVGQSRISKTLGAAKGMMTAQRNAKLDAESAFVAWLKSNTKSVEQSGDKTEFILKGDEDGSTESASSTETSSTLIQTTAEGAIRGLSLIGKDVTGEILTLVYGWKPDYAEIAREVEAQMNKEAEPDQATVAPAIQIQHTIIENTVIVTAEAGEFL